MQVMRQRGQREVFPGMGKHEATENTDPARRAPVIVKALRATRDGIERAQGGNPDQSFHAGGGRHRGGGTYDSTR